MKKSILVSGFVALCLSVSSLSAGDFVLRSNMMLLNSELSNLKRGFIAGDTMAVAIYVESFGKNAEALLGNRDNMIDMLPKEMKNKKHKVNIAIQSAREIEKNVKMIKAALVDKSKSQRKRLVTAQESYLNIVNECFKCHNLVRDKKALKK